MYQLEDARFVGGDEVTIDQIKRLYGFVYLGNVIDPDGMQFTVSTIESGRKYVVLNPSHELSTLWVEDAGNTRHVTAVNYGTSTPIIDGNTTVLTRAVSVRIKGAPFALYICLTPLVRQLTKHDYLNV